MKSMTANSEKEIFRDYQGHVYHLINNDGEHLLHCVTTVLNMTKVLFHLSLTHL